MRLRGFPLLSALAVIVALTLSPSASCLKVRYGKASQRSREENEMFAFLAKVRPQRHTEEEEEDPPAFATPPSSRIVFPTPAATTPAPPLSASCLSPRGQFAHPTDCHSYVDCWDGRVLARRCNPQSLVFDPSSGRCTWELEPQVKGRCEDKPEGGSLPAPRQGSVARQPATVPAPASSNLCSDHSSEGFSCVSYFHCPRGEIRRTSGAVVGDPLRERRLSTRYHNRRITAEESRRAPWGWRCPRRGQVCCRDPSFVQDTTTTPPSPPQLKPKSVMSSSLEKSLLCPEGFSGPRPFPPDCSKFANCWKGRPTVQDCAPGTMFNARSGQCDFPGKAGCTPDKRMEKEVSMPMGRTMTTHEGQLEDMEEVARASGKF